MRDDHKTKQDLDRLTGVRGEPHPKVQGVNGEFSKTKTSQIKLDKVSAPPKNPVVGMIVLPDGINWVPVTATNTPEPPVVSAVPNYTVSGSRTTKTGTEVAFDSVNSRYFVVWSDMPIGAYTSQSEIKGCILDEEGEIYTEVFPVDRAWSGVSKTSPALAFSVTSEKYLVVWTDTVTNNGGTTYSTKAIKGAIVDPDGTVSVAAFNISATTSSTSKNFPRVVWNSTENEFLVTYAQRTSSSAAELYAAIVQPDGTVSAPVLITSSQLNSYANNVQPNGKMALAYNSTDNEYLAVFENKEHGTLPISSTLWGRRINVSGSPTGSAISIVAYASPSGSDEYKYSYSALSYNSDDNNYLVVYTYSNASSSGTVYNRTISNTGTVGSANSFDTGTFTARDVATIYNTTDIKHLAFYSLLGAVNQQYAKYSQRTTTAGDGGEENVNLTTVNAAATVTEYDTTLAWNSNDNEYIFVYSSGAYSAYPVILFAIKASADLE